MFFFYLGFDIVLSVAGSLWFAATVLQVTLPGSWIMTACLSAWSVYLADRLADAFRVGETVASLRHRFYWRYRWVLSGVCVLGLLGSALWALWVFPVRFLLWGSVLGLLSFIHILLVGRQWYGWIKEAMVALLFTVGTWFPAELMRGRLDGDLLWSQWFVAGLFWGTVYVNLLFYAAVDRERDLADGTATLATVLYGRRFKRCFLMGVLGCCLMSVGLFFFGFLTGQETAVFSLLGVMVATMLLLFLKGRFSEEWLHMWGEIVFWGIFILFFLKKNV